MPRDPIRLALLALLALAAAALPLRAQDTAGPASPRELLERADALRSSGIPDDVTASIVLYERAASAAAEARASLVFARARRGKAQALLAAGESSAAIDSLTQALAVARQERARSLQAELLELLADAHAEDRPAAAASFLREAAGLHQEEGRFEAEGLAWLRASDLALAGGDRDAARLSLGTALGVFRHTGNTALHVETLQRRARLEALAGEPEAALETLQEVLTLGWELGEAEREGRTLLEMARVHVGSGDLPRALERASEAREACARAADLACTAEAAEELARLLLRVRQPRVAAQRCLEALRAYRQLGQPLGEARAHHGLGLALLQLDRLEPALAALREARPLLELHGGAEENAAAALQEARVLVGLQRGDEAVAAYDEALDWLDRAAQPASAADPFGTAATVEEITLEQSAFLVDAGLWARALEAFLGEILAGPGAEAETAPPDMDALRALTRGERATLLAWRVLDDAVVAWALPPDGRLFGTRVEGVGREDALDLVSTAAALAPRASAEAFAAASAREDDEESESWLSEDAGRLLHALRLANDLLVAPLEPALDRAGSARLIAALPRELRELPLSALLDESGRALASRHAIAELAPASLPYPTAGGDERLFVDTAGLEEPTLEMRALHEALAPPGGRPTARSGRDRPGRPRAREARRTDGDVHHGPEGHTYLVRGGVSPSQLAARARAAGVLFFLGPCQELALEGVQLPGSVVVLGDCDPTAQPAALASLLESGARSVVTLRWRPSDDSLTHLLIALARGLEPGRPVADAVRAVIDEWRASRPADPSWAAVRLSGASW